MFMMLNYKFPHLCLAFPWELLVPKSTFSFVSLSLLQPSIPVYLYTSDKLFFKDTGKDIMYTETLGSPVFYLSQQFYFLGLIPKETTDVGFLCKLQKKQSYATLQK